MKKIILLFIVLTAFALPQKKSFIYYYSGSEDTTGYWVDGTNGNDSYAGNYSYPWKTIQKANTSATAGSKVNIRQGTYIENGTGNSFYVNKKLKYYGKGLVVIKGQGLTQTLNMATTDTVWFYNLTFDAGDSVTYCVYSPSGSTPRYFYNCTFNYAKTAGARAFYIVSGSFLLDGCTFNFSNATYGFDIRVGSTITNSVFNCSNIANGVYVRSGGTTNLTNNYFAGGYTSYVVLHGTNTTLNITGNTANLTSNCLSFYYTGSLTSAVVNISDNNITTLRHTQPLIYDVLSSGVTYTISRNNITTSSTLLDDHIIEIKNNDVTVSDNTIETFTRDAASMVYLYSSATNIGSQTISNNTFRHRSKTGYTICIGTEGTTAQNNYLDSSIVQNNTIYGFNYYYPDSSAATIHGIFVGFNQWPTIKYNKVYGSGYGVVVKGSNSYGGNIYYNLISNCWQGIRLKGVKKSNLYNNTITNNLNNGTSLIYLSENVGSDGSDSTTIKNNIIANLYSGATNTYCIQVDTASNDGLISDYNCLYNLSTHYAAYEGATKTFATWQALGLDINSLNVNPEFTSATDFSLQSTSDCINAGTDVGLTQDILGNPIVGDEDMGSYEKQ